jgi:hypothetical protein
MQVDPLTKVLGMDPLMAAVASTLAAVSPPPFIIGY